MEPRSPGSAVSGFGDSLITPRQREFIAAGRAAARGDPTALDAFVIPIGPQSTLQRPAPTTPGPFTPQGMADRAGRGAFPSPPPPPPLPEVKVEGTRPAPVVPLLGAILTGIGLALYPRTTAPRRIDELQPDSQPMFPIGDPVPTRDPADGVDVGTAEPIRDPRDAPTDEPLEVISIVGRPSPGPGVSVTPDVAGFPIPVGRPAPFGTPRVQPRTSPGPGVGPTPFADPLTFAPPRAAPKAPPRTAPRPTVRPGPGAAPGPVGAPWSPFSPFPGSPLPGPATPFAPPVTIIPTLTDAPVKADPCNCPPAGKKKDKPKKRKARKMCTSGKYTTSRKGISHTVLERFPCP